MPLTYFQFDNLLRNRVQFFLFSWVDLGLLKYDLMEKKHLEGMTIRATGVEDIHALRGVFREKGLDLTAPILLVDEDGEKTRQFAQALDAEGYLNVFWIQGGLRELLRERHLLN